MIQPDRQLCMTKVSKAGYDINCNTVPSDCLEWLLSCLLLVGAYSAFCSLGLVAMAYLLLLVVLLALLMLLGLTGCAWLAMVVLLGMRGT